MTVADLMFYAGLGMVAAGAGFIAALHGSRKRPPGTQLRPHSGGAPNGRTSARPWHVRQPGGAASPTGSCLYQRRWQAASPLRMARQSGATQCVGNLVRALQGGNAFAGPASGQAGRRRVRGACAQRRPHRDSTSPPSSSAETTSRISPSIMTANPRRRPRCGPRACRFR